jgi:hypothetical protein
MTWQNDKLLARLLHYPQCWDTAAYPTLSHVVREIGDGEFTECTTCLEAGR